MFQCKTVFQKCYIYTSTYSKTWMSTIYKQKKIILNTMKLLDSVLCIIHNKKNKHNKFKHNESRHGTQKSQIYGLKKNKFSQV